MEKKGGFTVLESLIVSFILIVVILVGSFLVSNSLKSARKETFKREVIRAMQAGVSAYQIESVEEGSVCYSLKYLMDNNYFIYNMPFNYEGSVLVSKEGDVLTYYVWLEDENFLVNKASLANLSLKGGNIDGVIRNRNKDNVSLDCDGANAILKQ